MSDMCLLDIFQAVNEILAVGSDGRESRQRFKAGEIVKVIQIQTRTLPLTLAPTPSRPAIIHQLKSMTV
eukprot:315467-Amorphochlora_amoeboformis.AAC.1